MLPQFPGFPGELQPFLTILRNRALEESTTDKGMAVMTDLITRAIREDPLKVEQDQPGFSPEVENAIREVAKFINSDADRIETMNRRHLVVSWGMWTAKEL